jgi:hypothetical protein
MTQTGGYAVLYQAVRLLCLSFIISGCATNAPWVEKTAQIEKLGADNKGVVILHTSLHDGACDTVQARLAQLDASGRYVAGELINLKLLIHRPKLPSQITLPAGDYGIVALKCDRAYANRLYTARVAQPGNILDGTGTIYEQAFATFTVRPGEVVDIGSLQVPNRPIAALWGPDTVFNAVVVPIPEPWLQTLATTNPKLYSMRVTRLMKTPTKNQPRSEPTAEAAAR